MLTRTTARRSAAVVMVAVVAALLVVVGGSARTAHVRTSAGAGAGAGSTQTGAAAHGGRHVVSVHATSVDLAALHLDLATTPPADVPGPAQVPAEQVSADETADVSGDRIAAVGRGPPTA